MNRRGFLGFGAGAIAAAPGMAREGFQQFPAPSPPMMGSVMGNTLSGAPIDKWGILDDLRKRLADLVKTEAERREQHIQYALNGGVVIEPDIERMSVNWHTKRMRQARRYADREMRRERSRIEDDIKRWTEAE